MQLSRAQLLSIAQAVEVDPTIETVEIETDRGGKLRVSAIEVKPVARRIRLTKQPKAVQAQV